MNRRHFLAAGSAAALTPALAHAASSNTEHTPSLFRSVNFRSDGLEFTPAEYATRLQQVATRKGFVADNYSLDGAV